MEEKRIFLGFFLKKIQKIAESTDYNGKLAFVRDLEKEKEEEKLRILCNSGLDWSEMAASSLGRILEPTEAIKFCKSLETGSHLWRGAFWGLSFHPKEKVIDYVIECAKSQNASAKWFAYSVCNNKEWPELLPFASQDFSDETRVYKLNQYPDELTVGQMAKKYAQAMLMTGNGN